MARGAMAPVSIHIVLLLTSLLIVAKGRSLDEAAGSVLELDPILTTPQELDTLAVQRISTPGHRPGLRQSSAGSLRGERKNMTRTPT